MIGITKNNEGDIQAWKPMSPDEIIDSTLSEPPTVDEEDTPSGVFTIVTENGIKTFPIMSEQKLD